MRVAVGADLRVRPIRVRRVAHYTVLQRTARQM